MRTFFISDLHKGVSDVGDASVRRQAANLCDASRPDDVLIIGGDIAVDDETIGQCLDLYARFRGTKLAIPGNHDVWDGSDSAARFKRLTALFGRHGFVRLDDGPVVVGDTAYVGSMGWYDYSFRDDIGIELEWYKLKQYPGTPGIGWGDRIHVRWNLDDGQVTAHLVNMMERHLAAVDSCDKIVVAMHHLPTKRLLIHPRWLVPKHWRFANAFLGSDQFAEVILRYRDKVAAVLCGHVHRHARTRLDGVEFVSNGGDYDKKSTLLLEEGGIRRFLTAA